MYKRKIIVFGGQGFVGINLINHLNKKNYQILSLGRKSKLKNKNKNKNVKYHEINFYNLNKIKNIDFKNSSIVFSALSGNIKNDEFINKFKNLVLYLKEKKIKRFILLSSISVYGNSNQLLKENSKVNPLDNYAKNCLAAEQIINKIFNEKKNYVILRIANLFGVNRKKLSVIEKIIYNNILNNKYKFYKYNVIRSYISVNNLSQIIENVFKTKHFGKLYLVYNPNYIYSFLDLKKIFYNKLNFKVKYNFNSYNPIIKKSKCGSLKINKIFKFKNNFQEEIQYLINFYKKYDF